jgi:hypothetical protein
MLYVTVNACSILGSGVAISWYTLSSCDIIAGWCWRWLRWKWGNDTGTLGDGCRGSFCSGVTVSVGTLGDCICEVGWPVVVVTVANIGVSPGGDAILLNIVANYLIACIRFDPSCWKGVAGDVLASKINIKDGIGSVSHYNDIKIV